MNAHNFFQTDQMKGLKTFTGDKRIRDWQLRVGSKVWPEFMQHDKTVNKYWLSLYEEFSDCQFAAFMDDILLGIGNSIPLCWHQTFDTLPDRGLSYKLLDIMKDLAAKKGVTHIARPVRPTLKNKYPQIPMDISATTSEWEAWTNTRFPTSGDYIIDEALVPVRIDTSRNTGHYMEPNVWIVHEIK